MEAILLSIMSDGAITWQPTVQCTVKETGHKEDVFQSMMQVAWKKKSNYTQQEWNL